jgi:Protein of unknown function (DUF3489)
MARWSTGDLTMTDQLATASSASDANKPPSPTARPPKSAIVLKLLSRTRGATVEEMQAATGWQPHSVRAFLSGRRKAGLTFVKEERKKGETSYRTVAAAKPVAEPWA